MTPPHQCPTLPWVISENICSMFLSSECFPAVSFKLLLGQESPIPTELLLFLVYILSDRKRQQGSILYIPLCCPLTMVRGCSGDRGCRNKRQFLSSRRYILVETDIRLLTLVISGTKATKQELYDIFTSTFTAVAVAYIFHMCQEIRCSPPI